MKIRISKKKIRQRKQASHVGFIKAEENPILSPEPDNDWESWQTFNPGVILLEDKIHFIYRAIGEDGISRLGYANSLNGFIIDERLPYPIYEHKLTRSTGINYYSFASGGSFGGAEDPRIVRVGEEDMLYMTYTACGEGLRVGLTSICTKDFLQKRWRWNPPRLISPPNEVHKNWVIFPEKINDKYAILHSICPEISVDYRDNLEFQEDEYIWSFYDGNFRRKNCWDNWIRGAGSPPLKTSAGWLLFYHAMDNNDPGKYKVGALLLDLDDPTKILHRSQEPVLVPEKDYEYSGFKGGVVYVCGAVIKNDRILVYYGASDSYVSVAQADSSEFLRALTQQAKPQLKEKIL
ncbi:MAG: hypothetical protein AABY47_06685 [Pseudomonadota bacterium]